MNRSPIPTLSSQGNPAVARSADATGDEAGAMTTDQWIAYAAVFAALLLATGIGFVIVWFAWFAHGQPR